MIVFDSIQFRRGANILLDQASAIINPKQKVGLVGKNGCGKSTLFSLIKGQLETDKGSLSVPPHWRLSWVNQETPALDQPAIEYVIDGDHQYRQLQQQLEDAMKNDQATSIARLHEQLDNIDAWSIRSRAAKLLHGLGFTTEQLSLAVKSFSGGWRMRLNLAQALMCRSDLLLLDEPTNHLDLDAVIWLENWLSAYQGTLILISHDRDFLDPLVDKIIHIEHQHLVEYTGNYSSFEVQRAMKIQQQQALYESQQLKAAHLQKFVDRFKAKASKAKQAQSRIKMLERMEKIAPALVDNPFHFSFQSSDFLPSPLLTMEKAEAGYNDTVILEKIKFNLLPGSRIGLLGRNGAGKSTLIKLLAGELQPKKGTVTLAKGVQLGYFSQHQLDYLHGDESPLWHLSRLANSNVTEQALRNYLGGFDFKGDKVKERVMTFSGGEKARLVLALVVWQKPNLLLLDEPTNHLDLDMRQALIEALLDFDGALVVVSHDRHLLKSITDEFYLVNNQKVVLFDGDLDDYQKWLTSDQKNQNFNIDETIENNKLISNVSAQDKKEKKRQDAVRRAQLQPIKKQIDQAERNLDMLMLKIQDVENQLADPSVYDKQNKAQLASLIQSQTAYKQQLTETESNWLSLQEALDIATASENIT